jgi:hypothetical protein
MGVDGVIGVVTNTRASSYGNTVAKYESGEWSIIEGHCQYISVGARLTDNYCTNNYGWLYKFFTNYSLLAYSTG